MRGDLDSEGDLLWNCFYSSEKIPSMANDTAFQILLTRDIPLLIFPVVTPPCSQGPSAGGSSLAVPLCLFLHRPEKDGAATTVGTVCTHQPDPAGHRLDREQLYWELHQLTQGITRLGPYTLDQDSLYVNGEWQPCLLCYIAKPSFLPCTPLLFLLNIQHFLPLSSPLFAGYTYHTSEATPGGEYRVAFRSRYPN